MSVYDPERLAIVGVQPRTHGRDRRHIHRRSRGHTSWSILDCIRGGICWRIHRRDSPSFLNPLSMINQTMVHISRKAIQCPSSTYDFAHFALLPDSAGKLRNHFNSLKVRDSKHDAFFRSPVSVPCGQ